MILLAKSHKSSKNYKKMLKIFAGLKIFAYLCAEFVTFW